MTGKKEITVWQDSDDADIAGCLRRLAGDLADGDHGSAILRQVQQQAAAVLLSQSWADYLEWVDQLMDHVSLMRTGPNDPFTTFNKQIIAAYEHLLDTFETDLLDLCRHLSVVGGQIDLAGAGVKTPPSTRTYLIDDGSDTLDNTFGVNALVTAAMNPGLALLAMAARQWKKRQKKDPADGRE